MEQLLDRLEKLEDRARRLQSNPAPTVPNYGLNAGAPPPPPPVYKYLRCDCSSSESSYVQTFDTIPEDSTGYIANQVYTSDVYIPHETFQRIDDDAALNGIQPYTANLIRVGQAGEGPYLMDTGDFSAGGPGLMSQQWMGLRNSGGGTSPPATHPAMVEVSFAPDTWHNIVVSIQTQPYTSGGTTYNDFIHVVIELDGYTIYDIVELWGVAFGGPGHPYNYLNSIGYESYGVDNEIYFADNFVSNTYNSDFNNTLDTFPAFNSPNGSQFGTVSVVADTTVPPYTPGGPPPVNNPTRDITGAGWWGTASNGYYSDDNTAVVGTGSGSSYDILGNGVFYKWTAPSNGLVTVQTDAVDVSSPPDIGDTVLYILPNNTTHTPNTDAIAMNDDDHGPTGYSGSAYYSLVTFTAVAGTTYYFFVKGYSTGTVGTKANGSRGTYSVAWTY